MAKRTKVSIEEKQLQEIGVAFRNRRLDKKLNFQEMEKKSGVTSLTISKLEKGELKNSSLLTLNKIAGVLGFKIVIGISNNT